jgi:hypothetical protein
MGIKKLMNLERELSRSWTEHVRINRDATNPHIGEVLRMLGNRTLSLSLRKQLRMN